MKEGSPNFFHRMLVLSLPRKLPRASLAGDRSGTARAGHVPSEGEDQANAFCDSPMRSPKWVSTTAMAEKSHGGADDDSPLGKLRTQSRTWGPSLRNLQSCTRGTRGGEDVRRWSTDGDILERMANRSLAGVPEYCRCMVRYVAVSAPTNSCQPVKPSQWGVHAAPVLI